MQKLIAIPRENSFITPAKPKQNDTIDFLTNNLKTLKLSTPYYEEYKVKNSPGEFKTSREEFKISPPQKTHKYPNQQIGDSDSELSDSDTETDGSIKIAKFKLSSPIRPKHVTIVGQGGRLKGDEIILLMHQTVLNAISKSKENPFEQTQNDSPYRIQKKDDWLCSAGHMAKSMSDYECKESFQFESVTFGKSKINAEMRYENYSERLHLTDKKFLTKLYKKGEIPSKTDFSCKEIADITNALKNQNNVTDSTMARWQLKRLQGKSISSEDSRIAPWLDFVNGWLFGVEASRINTTFLTGIMVLELIQSGKMTYQEALHEDSSYGGQLPSAALNTGPKNFAARRSLLEHTEHQNNAVGLKEDRKYPQWLAITLKEALVVKNWLKMKGLLSRQETISSQRDKISQAFEDLIQKNYF